MTTAMMQAPIIYQRILNHPEFVFPIYFKAKLGMKKEDLAVDLVEQLVRQENDQFVLDERQDTVYYDHIFANNWSKIEAMTNK